MELKLQWLETRRQQILKDIVDCDGQSKAFFTTLLTDFKGKEGELNEFKIHAKEQLQQCKTELMKYATQVKSLQAVIVAKQDNIDRLKAQNGQLVSSNSEQNQQIQQMRSKILQLEHTISVSSESSQKKFIQLQQQLEDVTAARKEQIQKLTLKHQEELIQKEKQLLSRHEQAITQLKKNHLALIQKLQAEQQSSAAKSSQLSKKNESEYTRITLQNTKLISINGELKRKVFDLEGTLCTEQQQQKISLKQAELSKQNSRRQIEMLKEEREKYKQRAKKLSQKNDEISWQLREAELAKEEEIKKIKQEVDRSFHQILTQAQEESKEINRQNQILKNSLIQKEASMKQLQQICLKLKQTVEEQDAELVQLKSEKQAINKQLFGEGSPQKIIEQLRAQVIKKNCEIQVLQGEVKRLKSKVNSIASSYQQYVRLKQEMQNQNKMLLSEIAFLREKEKKEKQEKQEKPSRKGNLNNSNILNELNSEQSQVCQDVEQYKKIIQYMTDEMNDVCQKMKEKDGRINKLQAQLKRYQSQLNYR